MGNPLTLWRRFLARANDDPVKVFGVALIVALFSAVVVSTAAVTLKPLQDAHLEAERAARIEEYAEKFANPYVAAERGFMDRVIFPHET